MERLEKAQVTPDELVVLMLERLAKSKVDFTIENYATTRAAAERLLRTVGAVPQEPPKQLEAPPVPAASTALPARCTMCGTVHPNGECSRRRHPLVDDRTQLMPIYRPGRKVVYSGS